MVVTAAPWGQRVAGRVLSCPVRRKCAQICSLKASLSSTTSGAAVHSEPRHQQPGGSEGRAGCRTAACQPCRCWSPGWDVTCRLWPLLPVLPRLWAGCGARLCPVLRGDVLVAMLSLLLSVTGDDEYTCCFLCFPYLGIGMPADALPLISISDYGKSSSIWTCPVQK